MDFEVRMIRVKGDPVSEAYADFCAPSWKGFNLKFYNAVTPDTLKHQRGVTFGLKKNKHPLSETEKACFYSQYNLWKECALAKKPYLILEHDGLLLKPSAIHFNPHLMVQFFGQHAMEAVMFHPDFCHMLVKHLAIHPMDSGPMALVDTMLGYFNIREQSRYGLPHARYQGKNAPVKSVLDPTVGNTVKHKQTVVDRVQNGDGDLFYIIDLDINTN
jgi:hypothetical protein